MNTGERLSFWGSDAVGATLYGTHKDWRVKAGAYLLHENLIQQDDDVSLAELAVDRHIVKTWHLGANVRYLRDTSEGAGGIGILGQGPDSQLADYMGAYRFTLPDDLEAWRGHFLWSGPQHELQPQLHRGPGRRGRPTPSATSARSAPRSPTSPATFQKLTNVLGFAANVRAGVRYGRSPGDHIVAEGIVTSGDANGLEDGTYSGVMTGNTWGAPGAVYWFVRCVPAAAARERGQPVLRRGARHLERGLRPAGGDAQHPLRVPPQQAVGEARRRGGTLGGAARSRAATSSGRRSTATSAGGSLRCSTWKPTPRTCGWATTTTHPKSWSEAWTGAARATRGPRSSP